MEDQNNNQIGLPPAQAYIGAWSVDRYVRLVRWKVLAAAVVGAVLVFMHVSASWIMLGQGLFLLWIGERVIRARGERVEALTAGALAGLLLGAVIAVSKLIDQPSALYALNTIVETAVTAVVGSLLAVCATVIKTKILTPNQHRPYGPLEMTRHDFLKRTG